MSNKIINIAAFTVLTLLWLAFTVALLVDEEILTAAWNDLRGLPAVLQFVVWLLILPVTLGLWIWQFNWPVALRLILIAGLAIATLYVFFPWKRERKDNPSARP
jgi:hypothetical protein